MIIPFLAAGAILCFLGAATVDVLSATRTSVAGESLYSKGQKDAIYFIGRYLQTHADDDYRRFEEAIAFPLGDRQARIELDRPRPDPERVRAGLLQGGNHPDDIDAMIRLYRRFGHIGPFGQAVAIWADADSMVLALDDLAGRAHAAISSGNDDSPELAQLQARLPDFNARMSDLERRFSARLSDAARSTQRGAFLAIVTVGAGLALAGALLTASLLRRRAVTESALRESNARWDLAAAAAGIGVLDWDLRADRVVLDSRAAALYGLAPEDAPVVDIERILRVVHADDRTRLRTALDEATASGLPLEIRYRAVAVDGQVRHHEMNARVGSDEGSLRQRVFGILWDVTADVQREQLRLDKEAAERANAAKTAFLSRVSHELRTPLNAVLGFAQLLLADAARLDPMQRDRVQHIRQAGSHLLSLVDDVLDLVTIESGEEKLEDQSIALDSVLAESRRWVEAQANTAGVSIELRPAQSRVRGDERRLRQVLANLLSNAVKYTRPGGRVWIETVAQPDSDWCVLSVRDNGRGMSTEQLAQLFEPFNRLGAEREGIPGTGIGLNIARRLVERMGGRVEVQSALGQGTDFRLWLLTAPAGEDPSGDSPPVEARRLPAPCGTTTNLLYIEDNPVNVLLVKQVLAARQDMVVHIAVTGSEGVAAALALRPAIILIDMELPDFDGFEVLRRLRAAPLPGSARCIALSANAMPEYIDRALAAGFDDYWTKPIDFKRFLAALDALTPHSI